MFVYDPGSVYTTSAPILLVTGFHAVHPKPGAVIAGWQRGGEHEYWQALAISDTKSQAKEKFRGLQDKHI